MADSGRERIARRLAKQYGVDYSKGKGPDVKADDRVIDVVTHESNLYVSIAQVRRFKKPKYFAVPPELQKKAREVTNGTGIGLMPPYRHHQEALAQTVTGRHFS